MPQTYTVKDTETGQTVTFKWNEATPPTDADMADVFAASRGTAPAPTPRPDDGTLTASIGEHLGKAFEATSPLSAIRQAPDFARGALAETVSTIYNTDDLLRRALGRERIIDQPDIQAAMQAPPSPAGEAGKVAAAGAMFAGPVGAVTKGVKAAPWVARMAAEGATGAGVAALQTGGDPTSMALGAVAPAGLSVVGKTAVGAARGVAGTARAVTGRLQPRVLATQALRPRNTRIKFDDSADLGLPLVGEAEQAMGKTVETLDDFIAAVGVAKKQNRGLYNGLGRQAAGELVDLSPAADAIEKSIPLLTKMRRPQAVKRAQADADAFRRKVPVEEADEILRDLNANLAVYENKLPAGKSVDLRRNPETASDAAAAREVRTELYKVLDAPGGGDAARELQKRWGALHDLEDAAWRRKNVAARQQPENLTEQLTKVQAGMVLARAGARAFRDPAGAGADVLMAIAGRRIAKYAKEQQTTDALIRRAMQAVRKGGMVPGRIEMPPPPVPRPVPVRQGELVEPQPQVAGPAPYMEGDVYEPAQLALPAAGARPMPPSQRPDPSYVRAVQATPAPTMRQPRALPPAPSVREMPASSQTPPDPSYVRAVKAEYAKKVNRRPLTAEDDAEIERLIAAGAPTKATRWKVEQTHKPTEELFSAGLADAKKQGYPGSPAQLRAAYKAAVQDAGEHVAAGTSSQQGGQSHALLLKEIRRRGGISIAREAKHAGGLAGELKTLIEGNRGRSGALGPGIIVGRGARSKIGPDDMATFLKDVPGLGHITDPNALLAAIKDAEQYYTHGGTEARLSISQALEEIGVRPGTPWWTRFEISGDPTFDPSKF